MSRATQTRTRRLLTALALSSLIAAVGASGASAYLYNPSAGSATGSVAALAAPTLTAATAGTGTVALSWSPVTAPGAGTVSYYVRRDGTAPAGCPSASSPEALTSCTDTGLAPGNHVYTVTAVWRSWSARSSERSVKVTVGVADHLVISAATATPIAGASDSLTITAKDSAGTTVGTYAGTKTLTFAGAGSIGTNQPTVTNSSGKPVAFGTGEPVTFTSGVATGSMALYKAETATVTAGDGTLNSTGTTFTVAPAATSTYAITNPGGRTAGAAFAATITALDTYGNTTPSYTGAKTMSFSGPAKESPNGKAATYPTSVTFASGVSTAASSQITLTDAQTTTLTAKERFGSVGGTSSAFTIAPAGAASLGLGTPSPSSPAAGGQFNLALTALDAFGNTATAYQGTKALSFTGAAASPSGQAPAYPESVTFTEGAAGAQITLYKSGPTTLKASDGTISGSGSSFTVAGATAAGFSLSTPAPIAGTQFTETVTAKDGYGNTATYSGTKTLAWSGAANGPKGDAPKYTTSVSFSSGAGSAATTLYNAASTTLSVKEGSIAGTTAGFTVSSGSAKTFTWSSIGDQTAGTPFSATVTAFDAYGNVAAYEGSTPISFTGPESSPGKQAPVLPGSVNFTAGVGTATFTLYDAGEAVAVTATHEAAKGTSNTFSVSPLAASALSLPTPSSQVAGSAFGETISAIDSYGNLAVSYTGTKPLTFSGPATSPAGQAPSYPGTVNFTAGQGTAPVTLYSAEKAPLTATDGTLSGSTAAFTTAAAGTASFALSTPAPTAGTAFSETLTARDAYGNTAAYAGTKTITFSGPGNSPKAEAPKYPTNGSVSFTAGVATATITIYNAAATTLTAKEGSTSGTSASFTVAPAGPSVFSFAAPGTQTAGTPFVLTLTAADAYGNAAVYEGTKTVTFKGAEASASEIAPAYPATVAFSGGKGTANVTLYNAAATTLEASVSGGPKGSTTSFTVAPTTATKTAWTGISAGTGAEEGAVCLFTCTWGGFSKNRTWSAHVSVTDIYGNVASNVGSGHNVTLAMTESASTGTLSTKTMTMATTGAATTSSFVTYSSPNSNTWTGDSFTAQAAGFTTATATVKK